MTMKRTRLHNDVNVKETVKMKRFERTMAFTLIELLVVVAIIALLVSMLLPALTAARERARITKCSVNVRQMCMGMRMYAEDNNGVFPALINHPPDDMGRPAWKFWHKLIEPYLQTLKVKHCPSFSLYYTAVTVDQSADDFTGYGLNYCGWTTKWPAQWRPDDPDAGFGFFVPGDPRFTGCNPRGGCVRESQIIDPSNFIMLGDSDDNPDLISNYSYGILGPPYNLGVPNVDAYGVPVDMPKRHENGGNIGFTDGHCSLYKTWQLISPAAKSMWTRGFD